MKQTSSQVTISAKLEVSVIVPYFNGSKWIKRALQSVNAQTLKPKEIIVVDDGSEAVEIEFLEALSKEFNFSMLKQKNAGQAAARNLGIANATSDLICLLDQDDYFLPNHIETLTHSWELNNPKLAYVYGDLWRETESGDVITHSCIHSESRHPHTDLKTMIGTNLFILPSATLIHKKHFLAIGGFDTQFRGYEDDDLFVRFFAAGYASKFIDEAVSVWTLNTTSTSFSESMSRSRFLYFKKLLDRFPEGSLPDIKIFSELLAPRFAFQFAADVVAAVMKDLESFSERQARLREFRLILKNKREMRQRLDKKFLIATWPLATLGKSHLKLLLGISLLFHGLLSISGLPGIKDFLARYSQKN